jgi:thymidylate synthase
MKMETIYIPAGDLSDAWFQCIKKVVNRGYEYTIDKGSYEGSKRKEFDMVIVHIARPWERPLTPFTPEGVPAPTTDDAIHEYLLYLMSDDKKPDELYTYGEDIAPQIQMVIDRYKEYGHENNQLCMSVGNRDSINLEHSQCLRLIDTRIRYGALHFIVYFRSWDLYAGFPVNLGGIQLLKEYMASEIGVEDGEIIAFSKGLHLYEHFWSLADSVCGK